MMCMSESMILKPFFIAWWPPSPHSGPSRQNIGANGDDQIHTPPYTVAHRALCAVFPGASHATFPMSQRICPPILYAPASLVKEPLRVLQGSIADFRVETI